VDRDFGIGGASIFRGLAEAVVDDPIRELVVVVGEYMKQVALTGITDVVPENRWPVLSD
jgi:hypothetical protein